MKYIALVPVLFNLLSCGSGSSSDSSAASLQAEIMDNLGNSSAEIELNVSCSIVKANDSQTDLEKCETRFEGSQREWLIFTPVKNENQTNLPSPLLISLHGGADYAEYNVDYTGFIPLAAREDIIVVYPQGAEDTEKGVTGWNAEYIGDAGRADDVKFIHLMIDWIGSNYRVDLERVYVAGFSNGARMSHHLACNLGSKIAAIAAVSGSMGRSTYQNCATPNPLAVMQIHGLADVNEYAVESDFTESPETTITFWKEVNDCGNFEQQALADQNGDGVGGSLDIHSACSYELEVRLIELENFGHEWPSIGNGKSNADIDAAQIIWDFMRDFDAQGFRE